MPRRSSGEGTVYRLPNGRWAAMLELPRAANGKRRRRFRRAPTQAEAKRKLREMRQELDASGNVGLTRRTVAEAIEAYRRNRPQSAHDDWVLGVVGDGLGSRSVVRLTVQDCDDFLRAAAVGLEGRRPIGSEQLGRLQRALGSVLRNEQRLGHLVRNVAELSELPEAGAEAREQTALTIEQLDVLADAASGWIRTLVELSGRNGLRPAEARALRWIDLDLRGELLTVSGQMTRANRRGAVKRASNAARTVNLHPLSTSYLTTLEPSQSGLVVVTRTGSSPDRHNAARDLARACRRAGIPTVTPYELRHSAITHQADAGWSAFEIADWAGTSQKMISDRYRHRLRRVSRLQPGASDRR